MTETADAADGSGDMTADALAFILRLIGLPANPRELLHMSGKERLDDNDLLRLAHRFPVKVRLITSTIERLAATPLPVLASTREGRWVVVGLVGEGKVLIQDPAAAAPEALSIDAFAARWDGRVLLIARRAGLADLNRRFGFGWFMGAVRKYRQPLTEVLVASFFVQLCGLLTPLFFQVIIDKVFVHRGVSTLEVLAVGLVSLSVFEVILGGLRTYVLTHTSNRIDVELGARLFRHLFALPMAYFHARRVGDTTARVRELDNIRQFLTSSALTLALDLFFALLFLIVLFIYSPLLTLIVGAALPCYVLLRPRSDTGFPRAPGRTIQARF